MTSWIVPPVSKQENQQQEIELKKIFTVAEDRRFPCSYCGKPSVGCVGGGFGGNEYVALCSYHWSRMQEGKLNPVGKRERSRRQEKLGSATEKAVDQLYLDAFIKAGK